MSDMQSWDGVNKAIRECVGYGVEIWPGNNIDYIFDYYGENVGLEVVSIFEELNKAEVEWGENDLAQAARLAVDKVCKKYSFIDERSKMALEWKFAFDWR